MAEKPQIAIVGWADHQHYNKRNAPWVKLYAKLRHDPEWRMLEPGAAKLLIDIWTLGSKSKEGVYVGDIERLSYEIRETNLPQLADKLKTLAETVDPETEQPKWISLSPNYLNGF